MDRNCETIAATVGSGGNYGFRSQYWRSNALAKRATQPESGRTTKVTNLVRSLRSRLAEIKPGDPAGRTHAEVIAANLIEIASEEGPGAVNDPTQNQPQESNQNRDNP